MASRASQPLVPVVVVTYCLRLKERMTYDCFKGCCKLSSRVLKTELIELRVPVFNLLVYRTKYFQVGLRLYWFIINRKYLLIDHIQSVSHTNSRHHMDCDR